MNKFFVGRALGVKEPREKILPRALEDKDFMKNKTQLTKEKFDRGNIKMKDFNNHAQSNKMNFFTKQQKQVKKPNFNMKSPLHMGHSKSSHDLINLKRTSDVFLNTKHLKKDSQSNAIKSKFEFYGNNKMQKGNLSRLTNKLGPKNKAFNLPKRDYKSKNQQYGLVPKTTGGVTNYNETIRAYTPETESSRINKAKVVNAQFTDIPNKPEAANPTAENVYDVNENLAKDIKFGLGKAATGIGAAAGTVGAGLGAAAGTVGAGLKGMYEGAKNKYDGSDFARERARKQEYATLADTQRKLVLDDSVIKGNYMQRVKVAEQNKLMREADNLGQTGVQVPIRDTEGTIIGYKERPKSAISSLSKFANEADNLRMAVGQFGGHMTADRMKELGSVRVGAGFRYTVASGLPQRGTASKFAEFTGRDSTGRKLAQGGYQQYQQYEQPRQFPTYPQEVPRITNVKDAKRAYLSALVKDKLTSGKDFSMKGMEKTLRDLGYASGQSKMSRARQEAQPQSRRAPPQESVSSEEWAARAEAVAQQQAAQALEEQYQPPQQEVQQTLQTRYRTKKKKDKGASAYQKQLAIDNGYTIAPEDVDPKFGEKVVVQGVEKVISPYGDIVSRLKGGQSKKLEEVYTRQVSQIQ